METKSRSRSRVRSPRLRNRSRSKSENHKRKKSRKKQSKSRHSQKSRRDSIDKVRHQRSDRKSSSQERHKRSDRKSSSRERHKRSDRKSSSRERHRSRQHKGYRELKTDARRGRSSRKRDLSRSVSQSVSSNESNERRKKKEHKKLKKREKYNDSEKIYEKGSRRKERDDYHRAVDTIPSKQRKESSGSRAYDSTISYKKTFPTSVAFNLKTIPKGKPRMTVAMDMKALESSEEEEKKRRRERLRMWREQQQKIKELEDATIDAELPSSDFDKVEPSVKESKEGQEKITEEAIEEPVVEKEKLRNVQAPQKDKQDNGQASQEQKQYISEAIQEEKQDKCQEAEEEKRDNDQVAKLENQEKGQVAEEEKFDKGQVVEEEKRDDNQVADKQERDNGQVAEEQQLENAQVADAQKIDTFEVDKEQNQENGHVSSPKLERNIDTDEKEKTEEDTIDPLDAYMAGIVEEAIEQESFVSSASNVISLEDLQSQPREKEINQTSATKEDADGLTTAELEAREEEELREFMRAIKEKRQREEELEQQSIEVNDENGRNAVHKSAQETGRIYQGLEEDTIGEEAENVDHRSALEILQEAQKKKDIKPVDHSKVRKINGRMIENLALMLFVID